MKKRPMSDQEKLQLQQVILPVFAAPLDGNLIHLGSCFIISPLGRQALFLSAAHVFQEALNIDGSRDANHPTTPLDFIVKPKERKLNKTRLLALYRDNLNSAHFADILDVYINDPIDIAAGSISFPDSVPQNISFSRNLSIDTRPPQKGTPIITTGYGDTKLDVNISENIAKATLEYKLDYRHGTITDVFSSGDNARRYGPSYQIDAPISSGMSGGPVINKLYGDHFVVCGINRSDFSFEKLSDCSGSGQRAIAHMLWPSMGITIKHAEINGILDPVRLIDLVKEGYVHDLGNAPQHVIFDAMGPKDHFAMMWR